MLFSRARFLAPLGMTGARFTAPDRLLTDGRGKPGLKTEGLDSRFPAALDIDLQALDFLVERRERNLEAFSGLRLAPTAAFEHVKNNAALASFHNLEQRPAFQILRGKAASGCGVVLGKLFRQEFRPEGGSGGKH